MSDQLHIPSVLPREYSPQRQFGRRLSVPQNRSGQHVQDRSLAFTGIGTPTHRQSTPSVVVKPTELFRPNFQKEKKIWKYGASGNGLVQLHHRADVRHYNLFTKQFICYFACCIRRKRSPTYSVAFPSFTNQNNAKERNTLQCHSLVDSSETLASEIWHPRTPSTIRDMSKFDQGSLWFYLVHIYKFRVRILIR